MTTKKNEPKQPQKGKTAFSAQTRSTQVTQKQHKVFTLPRDAQLWGGRRDLGTGRAGVGLLGPGGPGGDTGGGAGSRQRARSGRKQPRALCVWRGDTWRAGPRGTGLLGSLLRRHVCRGLSGWAGLQTHCAQSEGQGLGFSTELEPVVSGGPGTASGREAPPGGDA